MSATRFTHCFTLCLLLCPSLSVNGEEILDEIIVTATKDSQPLRELASTLSVVDSDALSDISHTHINEALQRVPGVWLSRGNGQEHLTAIRSPVLTGAGSCGAFLMSQDGISLRAPGFCNVNELFEATTELADRIEVVKGPGSSVHGSNALHGIVNIISPEVEPDLRRITIEAGPHDYARSKLSLSSDKLRLDFSGTHDGGYKDESGFDQQKLLLKHHVSSAQREINTTFSYTNLNQETAGFIRGDEVYKHAGAKRDNPNPEAYRDARSIRLVSAITHQFDKGEISVKPYLRSVEMEFLQHFLPGQAIEKNGHDSVGLQTLWTSNSSALRAGLELELTRGYLEETQPGATTGSAFLVATIPAGKHYDYEVDASLAGLFVSYNVDISQRLSLNGGLRYQYTSYDYNNKMNTGRVREDGTACGFGGCRFNRPGDRRDSFSKLSPRLGMIYNLSEQHQIYGSLSQGFRAPQATELYRLQGAQDVSRIDPVELDAIEIGVRGDGNSISYNLSVYGMQKNNFIFRDTSRTNVDNGETRHRGIELDLRYRVSDQLSAALAFTYARHEYDNNPALSSSLLNGNTIDTAPETLGSMTLDWHPAENLSMELEWVHVGDYYEDPENRNSYEGHDLLHLRTKWQATKAATVFARIMNLSDEDYAERADFAFGSDRYFVGTPRSVYLGVTLRW